MYGGWPSLVSDIFTILSLGWVSDLVLVSSLTTLFCLEPERHSDVESMGALEPEYSMDRAASRARIPCERRYVTQLLCEGYIVHAPSFVNCGRLRKRMDAQAVVSNLAYLVGLSLDVAW
jgi:hypothetical protein